MTFTGTVAAIRALSTSYDTVFTTDYGGGTWNLDPLDTTTMDNTGTILVAGTHRYKRVFSGSVDIRWFGAKMDGLADDYNAWNAALLTPHNIFMPEGISVVSQTIFDNLEGREINGSGADNSILKAASSFTGSEVMVIGNKSTSTVIKRKKVTNLTINCSDQNLIGIAIYGVRDGSNFKNITIRQSSGVHLKTASAGDVGGSASFRMCEGVFFENIHCITLGTGVSGDLFQIDGCFESIFINCKALLQSTITSTVTGYQLGKYAEVRGVQLNGCSAANYTGTGSYGIQYNQWASECWDEKCSFERIEGNAVLFDGAVRGGVTFPKLCKSLNPRLYNNETNTDLNPAYRFATANSCHAGVIGYFNSNKVWVRFDGSANQFQNSADIEANILPQDVKSSIVSFDVSSAASNLIYGYSSASTERKKIFITKGNIGMEVLPDGTYIQTADANSTWQMGVSDILRLRDKTGNTIATYRGSSPASGSASTVTYEDLVKIKYGNNLYSSGGLTLLGRNNTSGMLEVSGATTDDFVKISGSSMTGILTAPNIIYGDNSFGVINYSGNMDDIAKSGFYYSNLTSTNRPDPLYSFQVLHIHSTSSAYAYQYAIRVGVGTTYVRTKNAGTWTNWKLVLTESDLYTKTQLQTSGQSQINWANITNTPFLSSTQTLSFSSILAGQEGSISLTISNAAIGDQVIVSALSNIVGLTFKGIVTAANTVTVYACNFTNGNLGPTSGSFKVTVIKI
jgi:hypothetical protein